MDSSLQIYAAIYEEKKNCKETGKCSIWMRALRPDGEGEERL